MSPVQSAPRLAIGAAALEQLRVTLERELPDQSASLLREVGFAAGPAAYDGFAGAVGEKYGVDAPQGLDVQYLSEALAAFFEAEGWGPVSIEPLAPRLVALDSAQWAEASPRSAAAPSCHFSAGLLSDFFTRLGGYPAAVLEVECRSAGQPRCRFLVGSPEVLTWLYEGLVGGSTLDELYQSLRG